MEGAAAACERGCEDESFFLTCYSLGGRYLDYVRHILGVFALQLFQLNRTGVMDPSKGPAHLDSGGNFLHKQSQVLPNPPTRQVQALSSSSFS